MDFKLLHLCPDLMNLYGGYGNLWALRRAICALGHRAEISVARLWEKPDFSADLVFMGAGTERSQKAALEWLRPYAAQLADAAGSGVPMLFSGNSMELLGRSITDKNGELCEGLGIAEFVSVQGGRRIVGDVFAHTGLYKDPVVGFMNKSGIVSGVKTPLLTGCRLGFGNETENGPEGYLSGAVIASQLTGPLLVKNPKLLEWVSGRIFLRRGLDIPETFPHSQAEIAAYEVTCRELGRRIK